MKAIHWIIAAAALSFAQAAPASAGVNDPEILIYRFPGVRDDGGTNSVGVATVFFCTNFSGVQENIRIVTRDFNGTLKTNVPIGITHLNTLTAATHPTSLYVLSAVSLGTGAVFQGTVAIAATSVNIICTAVTIDAADVKPAFAVPLRGIRFNPAPGSQE